MEFFETKLSGIYIVEMNKIEDERGFFARAWCQEEFEEAGLVPKTVQINVGYSERKGTLRGMHYQETPHREVKLVRCTRGVLYDVVVDLRPESPTYKKWVGVELSSENHRMMYVPEGCAHGYQTLEDDTEMVYQTSEFYAPEVATGVRYNDPEFDIEWPMPVEVISDTDADWPDFEE